MLNSEIKLNYSEFPHKGLYLIFEDSSRLELTEEKMNLLTDQFWDDETKLSSSIKEASDFQKCVFCPVKNEPGICPAIRPVLPYLEILDKYSSFDDVIAVFRGDDDSILHLANTTMQQGLKYVSINSLLHHCANNQKYFNYFFGINPIVKAKEIASRLYLNMYWVHRGNMDEVKKFIAQIDKDLRITTRNQLKRVQLIAKNDAFVNALYDTQMITEFLSLGMERTLEEAFVYSKD